MRTPEDRLDIVDSPLVKSIEQLGLDEQGEAVLRQVDAQGEIRHRPRGDAIRIISAREVMHSERKLYEEG